MPSYSPDTLTLEALRSAPVPDFIERDPEALTSFYVTEFERLSGRTLYQGQTEMYVIEVMAYAHSILGEAAQAAFLQNRAIWAVGRHLEEVGANVSTFRLPAHTAASRVRFTLSEPSPVGVLIAAGTRVAPEGEEVSDLIFSTIEEVIIPSGQLSGDVDVIAAEPGLRYNDFAPGQISNILDPIAYVSTVENIIASGGGSDQEDDDRYRLRIVNAFERISRAGPREGYVEHVKAVNPAIIDVAVVRPQPGYIEITPLMGDGVSSDAIDRAILDYLDPETIVPMGDYVSIKKASMRTFDVALNVRIFGASQGLYGQIDLAVRTVFQRWTLTLGSQIAPSAILAAVKALDGVVDVTGPGFDYTDLAATEFAGLGNVTINLVDAPNV